MTQYNNENIGFEPKGRFSEDPSGKDYKYSNEHYNDNLMREALRNVKDGKYSPIKNNCQDWAERLRNEYKRLEAEQKKIDIR